MTVDLTFEHTLKLLTPEFVVEKDFFDLLTHEQCVKERDVRLANSINKIKNFLGKRKAGLDKSAFLIDTVRDNIIEQYKYENWYRENTQYEISQEPIEIGDKVYAIYQFNLRSYPNHKNLYGYKSFLRKVFVSEKDVNDLNSKYVCIFFNETKTCIYFNKKSSNVAMSLVANNYYRIIEDFIPSLKTLSVVSVFIPRADSKIINSYIISN